MNKTPRSKAEVKIHADKLANILEIMIGYAESPDFNGAPSDAALKRAKIELTEWRRFAQ